MDTIRLYCEHVYRSEAEQDLSTDPKRLKYECVHCMSTFQDGDSPISKCSCVPTRLDVLDRSQGRLSPCFDSPRIIQISAVGPVANRSVSLPGSAFQVEYSATDIHPHSTVYSQLSQIVVLSTHACVPYLHIYIFRQN